MAFLSEKRFDLRWLSYVNRTLLRKLKGGISQATFLLLHSKKTHRAASLDLTAHCILLYNNLQLYVRVCVSQHLQTPILLSCKPLINFTFANCWKKLGVHSSLMLVCVCVYYKALRVRVSHKNFVGRARKSDEFGCKLKHCAIYWFFPQIGSGAACIKLFSCLN